MTLLAPGVMLLAAGLTIPPLIVFYLLKLRRRPLRVTSTMLWEQAVHDLQVNVPFRWIRPNWLLLLHAIILALLLTAVGRPAIDTGGIAAGRVFVLVDRSASMSARDMPGGQTRLDAAKALAIETIESLSRGADSPEITLIAYAAEPVVLAPPGRDRAMLISLVNGIEPTDQPARPAEALALVRSLLLGWATDEDENAPPSLTVVVSDGAGFGGGRLSTGDPMRFVTVEPIAERPPNVGIVAMSVERDPERPERVRVFVRTLNAGGNEVAAPLVVRLDDEPVARRAVRIPAGPDAGTPGETVETLTLDIPGGGVLSVSIEHADALPIDNTALALLSPYQRPSTLLVTPTGASEARRLADPFLLDVLEALGTEGLRVIDIERYARLDEASLAGYGVVVFDRVAPGIPPLNPTLSFGAAWPGLGDAEWLGGRTGVIAWNRGHPVMRDVVMDQVLVARRLKLPEDDEGAQTGPRRRHTTLARGDDGPLIIEIDDAGTPRIVVGFALEQSTWPVNFSYPIFMLSAFDRLAPGSMSGVWFETGFPATVRLDRPARRIALDGPISRTIEMPGEEASATVPLGMLGRAGLYNVSAGGVSRPVVVNLLDSGESGLAWITPEGAEALATAPMGGVATEQREIWRLFILAAALLLLVEWLVYARRARF